MEAENFFLIQWYPDEASAKAKLAQLEELGDGKQYLVDLDLKRTNPTEAENFGNSNPVQLRSYPLSLASRNSSPTEGSLWRREKALRNAKASPQ